MLGAAWCDVAIARETHPTRAARVHPQHPANALVHRPLLLTYVVSEAIKVRRGQGRGRRDAGSPLTLSRLHSGTRAHQRPATPRDDLHTHMAQISGLSPIMYRTFSQRRARAQSNAQLDGAFEYLKRVGPGEVVAAELEEAAGVGVVVSPEQIAAAVDAAIEGAKERLLEERCAAFGGGLGRLGGLSCLHICIVHAAPSSTDTPTPLTHTPPSASQSHPAPKKGTT